MEQTSISSDLIRGHIDTIILHTLISGDKFAQQISDCVEEKSESQYRINQATLYSSLKRLESLKYVSSYMNDIEGGRRKFFKITQDGKDFVEKNLTSWTFSRAIIDKLIDTKPEVEVKEVKTVVYLPSPDQNFDEKPVLNTENTRKKIEHVGFYDENPIKNVNPINDVSINEEKIEISLENQNNSSNFRSILSDLISSTKKTATKNEILDEKTEIEPENSVKNDEKAFFNEVIEDINYNPNKANNHGKIDFGDLAIKANEEGYKIKISSKDSALTRGSVKINRVKFLSVFLVFILASLQMFALDYFAKGVFAPYTKYIVVSVMALIPLFFLLKLIISPSLKTDKNYSGDKILTSIIVVFNLILITLALNFIFNVNFNDISSVIFYTVIPILLFINSIFYFVFEFLFAKNKNINTK